jgi:hypothetical protein
MDVYPRARHSQGAVAAHAAGTDVVARLQGKLSLRSLFPNDGSIADTDDLFAPVSVSHHEPVTTLAAEYRAGQISRVVPRVWVVRRLCAGDTIELNA